MPECHNCPYDGKGAPECIDCKGPPDTNHQGQTFVSVDAVFGLATPTLTSTADLDLKPCCCDAVRQMLAIFVVMNDTDRLLVCYVLRGGTPTAWARSRGLTKQSAFQRVKRLVKTYPWLKNILTKDKS